MESKISEISFNLNPGFNINAKDPMGDTNAPKDYNNHSHTSSMCVLDMTYQNLKGTTIDPVASGQPVEANKAQDNFSRFGMNFKFTQKRNVTEAPKRIVDHETGIIKDYVDPRELKRYL